MLWRAATLGTATWAGEIEAAGAWAGGGGRLGGWSLADGRWPRPAASRRLWRLGPTAARTAAALASKIRAAGRAGLAPSWITWPSSRSGLRPRPGLERIAAMASDAHKSRLWTLGSRLWAFGSDSGGIFAKPAGAAAGGPPGGGMTLSDLRGGLLGSKNEFKFPDFRTRRKSRLLQLTHQCGLPYIALQCTLY